MILFLFFRNGQDFGVLSVASPQLQGVAITSIIEGGSKFYKKVLNGPKSRLVSVEKVPSGAEDR